MINMLYDDEFYIINYY